MLLVKSNIFGTVLNTQNMQETNRYLNNLYIKRSRDPTSEPPPPATAIWVTTCGWEPLT
jgi:hypothetical protein